MPNPAPHTPSRGPLVFLGVLAAFASFAVIAAGLQIFAGGKPEDSQSKVRLDHKEEIAKAQMVQLKKYGLADNADAVIAKAVEQIGTRKLEASKVVVPGSPTAIKQSAPAPAPAPPVKPEAPPTPEPTPAPATAPAPVAPINPPPVPAAPPSIDVPATPAPDPVPATPPVPPVPPVPDSN